MLLHVLRHVLYNALLLTRSGCSRSFEKVYCTVLLLFSSSMTTAGVFFMLCVVHVSARYVHLLMVSDDTGHTRL